MKVTRSKKMKVRTDTGGSGGSAGMVPITAASNIPTVDYSGEVMPILGKPVHVASATGVPISAGQYALPNQSNPMLSQYGSNPQDRGQLNASSKKDLIGVIGNVIDAYNGGSIIRDSPYSVDPAQKAALSKQRTDFLRSAVYDSNTNRANEKWNMLGSYVRDVIQTTLAREGVVRKFMLFKELIQGEDYTMRLRKHEGTAIITVNETEIVPRRVRAFKFNPQEFRMKSSLLVDIGELLQTTDDILEEAYDDCLEGIMVTEDRHWKSRADMAVTILRDNLNYFTSLTPSVLHRIKWRITRNGGVPIAHYLFEGSVWEDLKEKGSDWVDYLDPVHRWDLVENGILGSWEGIPILTDNFRQPNLKFLNRGEIYAVAAPDFHGAMTTRGPMIIQEIDNYNDLLMEKGFLFWQMLSMTIKNAASVSKGQKV
jgi:hypothetical protein